MSGTRIALRTLLSATAIAALELLPLTAYGQPAKPVAPAAPKAKESCAELFRLYDAGHRRIASIEADGVGDNSAPRATIRQLEINGVKQDQQMLLEFMRARNCGAPPQVGSYIQYYGSALSCALARTKGEPTETVCDSTKWVPAELGESS